MPDQTSRERTLVKYLNEAYGKEKQLETALQAQIKLAEKTLKKRLQDHLKETKAQARGLEKRIKQLGGKADASAIPGPEAVATAATALTNKVTAAAKGPVQALRGTGKADNLLRNVRDAFWNEAEEIAHYNLIEALADQLGDRETSKLAKEYRRQEERMQKFLDGQIKQLVKAVVREEVPAKERKPAAATSSSSRSRSTGGTTRSRASSGSSSSRSSRSSGSSRSSRASSSGTTKRASSSGTTKRASSSGTKRASSSRSSGSSRSSRASSSGSSGSSGSSRSRSSGSSRSSRSSGSSGSSGSSSSGSSGSSSS